MRILPLFALLYLLLVHDASAVHYRRRNSHKKTNPMAHLICNRAGSIKSYAQDTASFYYHGLITKNCSKKQRKKAKKNFRWYRNWAIFIGICAASKWKFDRTKQEVDTKLDSLHSYVHNELPDIVTNNIVNLLDNPSINAQKLEAALKRKMVRTVSQEAEQVVSTVKSKSNQLFENLPFPVRMPIKIVSWSAKKLLGLA